MRQLEGTGRGRLSRRGLLTGTGVALGGLAAAPAALAQDTPPPTDPDFGDGDPTLRPDFPPAVSVEPPAPGGVDWAAVRGQWSMAPEEVNLSAMLFASNPRIVRDAINRHRMALDARPVTYLERNNRPLQNAARAAAGQYFGTPGGDVALCENTTEGVSLLYAGINVRYGDEVLTTTHDYYVTHESLRMSLARTGGVLRKIQLFEASERTNAAEIVGRLIAAIGPRTRVLALTWVHSSTGLKMPIRAIADALAPINAGRPQGEKVLLCVDGAHGFGVENETLPSLGADFVMAGCHKWLFGPRGTGVVFGTPLGWSRVSPTVPTFLAPNAYGSWIGGYDPGPTTAARMTPGGFKAFEHVWSLIEAFQFHEGIGKAAISARTHELGLRLKDGLNQMPHITVRTPMDPNLCAGIVSFDVEGMSADAAVHKLRNGNVIASAAPYAVRHVRLTPSFRNTPEEVDYALNLLNALKPRARR
ncbi:MAG: aminotransferase [Caulobacter sp.]|nr:aminotransferase [Caulobacter sp.]